MPSAFRCAHEPVPFWFPTPVRLQFVAIVAVGLVVVFMFLPYLRHVSRMSAVNKVLLLQFPSQLYNLSSTPTALAKAIKV